MSDKMRDFYVAPYALVDVIRALNNEGIYSIWVTKSDNDLLVRWRQDDEDRKYKKNYDGGDSVPFKEGE